MRQANSYRAARRNAARADRSSTMRKFIAAPRFGASRKATRPPTEPRYVPYVIKPPTMKIVGGVPVMVERKQPRSYWGNGIGNRRARERALHKQEAA